MNSSRRQVVITGMGALCALGDQPKAIFDALSSGTRPFAPPTIFPADIMPGVDVAEVRDFAPQAYIKTGNTRPLDRTGRLALVGVELALADSGWTLERRAATPLGLILGTMFCSVRTIAEFDRRAQQAGVEYASPMDFSNTVLNAAAGQVAIWQKLRGVNSTIATGATSGLHAIGYGSQLIQRGRAEALVTGGAEEICYESCFGFHKAGRLANGGGPAAAPFDAARSGTAMGEGAAFLVLEAEESASARGATVVARVLGFANSFAPSGSDPGRTGVGPASDVGRTGVGPQSDPKRVGNRGVDAISGAIQRALADSGLPPTAVDLVVASASGSPDLDAREAAGIAAVVGTTVPVTALKSMTGEALGASGPLQTLTAILSLRNGALPGIAGLNRTDPAIALNVSAATRQVSGTHALITAVSPEGNCCALVLGID